jgi:tetratricopeptide (TPR) repeat protein
MTRLLLIGVEGLDFAAFDRLARPGSLEHLASLRRRGAAGWIAGSAPGDGPAGWATLATGQPPEIHGVWRREEAWAGGLRPISRAAWRAPPLWARLEAAGISTGGAGWPALRPGAAWPGAHIDEDFAAPSGRDAAQWAVPLDAAPADAVAALRGRRVHPTQITAAMLRGLVPDLADVDQSRDASLPRLATAMARAATIQAAAAWMVAERAPEAVFVHQPWLGQVRAQVESRAEAHLRHAVAGAWRFLDGLVGRLVELAGPEAMILLVSPGWRGRPGVLVAASGAATPPSDFQGADLLDVAPTVLAMFGLEDQDLPGRAGAWLRAPAKRVRAPSPPAPRPIDPDVDLLRAVTEAGYPPPPPPPAAWRAQGLAELAVLLLPRSAEAAERACAEALALHPDNVLALRIRATALVSLGEAEPLAEIADALERNAPGRGWGALARGAWRVLRSEVSLAAPHLARAEADADPDTLLTVAAVWLAASRPANAERVLEAILARDPGHVPARIGLAMTSMARRDFLGAEATLHRAAAEDPGRVGVYLQLARLYALTARPGQADRASDVAMRLGATADEAAAARDGRDPYPARRERRAAAP